jgi:asparagine synthase (glutamine-hydrolysing)
MCGILGMIGSRFAGPDPDAAFASALETLASRGPDDHGVFHDPPAHVHLGHRRLSIIDLACGHQPMTTPDGRFTIVFNGEIYNYRELRKRLEAEGARFATHSDTEVLLLGFATWGGPALLPRLDGIFAFAIYDQRDKVLYAARDRFGIKPLFYSDAGGGLIFASTLAPFWKLPDFPRRLHPPALRDYLAAQSIFAPDTILRDVHALPPASWLRYDLAPSTGRSAIATGRYWDIPQPTRQPADFEQLVEQTDAALARSVHSQLVADVPLGAFLSGGIDSSLMVHYMRQAGADPLRTFSVAFDAGDRYDESPYARQVAEQFACEHTVFPAAAIGADDLTAALAALDQPLADPAYLPTVALSRLTRRHVTVAISGDGGDELFGGYSRFERDITSCPPGAARSLLRRMIALGLLPGPLLSSALTGHDALLWDRVRLGPFPRSRKDMAAVLTPETARDCGIEQTLDAWRTQLDRFPPAGQTDSLMRADLWTYLADNCLVKTDRASMAHSLEVRVPLLGNDVVDLVLPQPASVKLARGLKSVLKELARRHLPRPVWDRPKHGFSVPLKTYFAGPWQSRGDDWVRRAATLAPFLNAPAVHRRWSAAKQGRGDMRVMYTLLVLLGWLETHPMDF